MSRRLINKILGGTEFYHPCLTDSQLHGDRLVGVYKNSLGSPTELIFGEDAVHFVDRDLNLPYQKITGVELLGDPETLKSGPFLNFVVQAGTESFLFSVGGNEASFRESFGLYKFLKTAGPAKSRPG